MHRGFLIATALCVLSLGLAAQSARPTIVVAQFTAKSGVDWPYDFQILQKETVAKLQLKLKDKAVVTADASGASGAYTLDGEITRMYQSNNLDVHAGGTSSNNETINVHYWLVDSTGKKVFDKTATYITGATGSFSNAQFGTAGPMAKDLESDLASRVGGAKIYSER
ncbi:MAG TPA: hypothetical protein VN690_04110 [Terriglobales bacterium]|nr:hypothetical protein [Terriglobales bacterium]